MTVVVPHRTGNERHAEPPAPGRRAAGDRLLRGLARLLVVVYFASGLGYLALRHLVWPNPGYWLPHVERALSQTLGKPVAVESVRTGFDGLRPWFEAHNVTILDDDGSVAFSTMQVQATLSLRGLAIGRLHFARLDIEAPTVRIERLDRRRLKVAGIVVDLDHPAIDSDGAGAIWLFEQRRIDLHDVDLQWIDRVSGHTLRFRHADLALGSVGRRHRASVRIPDAGEFGREFAAAIEVLRPAWSRDDDWRQWNGRLYMAAGRAELPAMVSFGHELRALLGMPGETVASNSMTRLEIERGAATGRLWLDFERGAAVDGLLRLSARDLATELSGVPMPLVEADIEADLRRTRAGETQVRLRHLALGDGRGFELTTAQRSRSQLRFAANGGLAAASLALEPVDSARLLEIAQALPLPQDLRERLAPLRLGGVVERLGLSWEAGLPARYSLEAGFNALSFARDSPPPPAGKLGLPSFEHVSGTVALDQAGGRLTLAGRKSVIRFPGLFAEPEVPFESLDARVDWSLRRGGEGALTGVDVDIESARFANADAAGEVTGRYSSGGKGDGIVAMSGRLTRANATRVARYLPLDIAADVREWVARAITEGNSEDARFVLRGDLEDFPYRDPASGEFRVEVAMRDTALAYAPGWPAIDRIRGRLIFERAGMEVVADAARVWGVALTGTHAMLPEFRKPVLKLEGSADGPAQDMVRFVNESPLRIRAGDFTRDLGVGGSAKLKLNLEMPIDDADATHVTGSVQLAGNEVTVERGLPALAQVSGTIQFTEKTLALRDVTGEFLGGTVKLDGEGNEADRVVVRASGRTSAAGIRQLADNVATQALDGAAEWRANLELHHRALAMKIESDLVGLASRLPAPFGKARETALPLRIETTPSAPGSGGEQPARDLLQIALGEQIHGEFERERDASSQQMRVRRAAFAIGADAVMPDNGFAVRLNAPRIDIDAWAAVLGPALADETASPAVSGSPTASIAGFSLLPSQLSVVAGDVHLAGKDLHEVVLGATRAGGFWRANVHSREIDGFFNWRAAPPGQPIGTLTARFNRLEIPRSRVGEVESLLDSAPSLLPELDISAEQFVLDERPLGRLTVKALNTGEPGAPVWRLESLKLENTAATLTANGEWKTLRGERSRATALNFELALRDAGQMLAISGFPGTMRNGAGSLSGQVAWTGSPLAIDYPSLDGNLSLSLDNGEFLKTEPGIAKLIGVLNLQSLRRRLAFDFRDLFAEGFAFTDVRATARLAQGVAHIGDFTMRGVTAQVRISGDANLVAETQDLLVEVRPELNAGLASLAYAALANPAIGLASFAAQLLLRGPLQQLFAWTYEVTGPWSDPQVTTKSRPTVQVPPQPSGG